nr:AsmA-like C-terminal region-containing protein [Amorphus orientalis]
MSLGVAVIMVLTAALVGPFLVDWTVYRDLIEAQAEKLLGEEVRVLGEADVRLLPAPRIALDTVRVGPQDNPILTADRVELEIDLSPLLKRQVDVVALTFVGPEIRLTVEPDGSVRGPTLNLADGPLEWVDPANVRFDDIDVVDGRLLIADRRTGDTTRIDDIALSGSGRSIHGPFDAQGDLSVEGTPYEFRVVSGSYVAGSPLTVKARVSPVGRAVNYSLDGQAVFSSSPAELTGALTVAPRPPETDEEEDAVPWRIEGLLSASANGLSVSEAEVRYGPIDRPLVMQAALSVPFLTDQGFRLTLSSRQMDVDGLMNAIGRGGEADRPIEKLAPLTDFLAAVPLIGSEGVVNARLASVVAGGALIENLVVEARPVGDGWRIVSARARLPGETAAATSGRLIVTEPMRYSGEAEIVSDKPGAFVRWWQGRDGGAVPVRSRVRLDGAIEVAAGDVAMPAMRLETGETTLLGSVRYRPQSGTVRGAVDMDLRADSLDVRPLLSLADTVSGSGFPLAGLTGLDHDITLYLTADATRMGGIEAGALSLDAALIDGSLTVDTFDLADLGGSHIRASGQLGEVDTGASGTVTGRITGDDLGALAGLAQTLAPGSAVSRRLSEAAPDLAPADLSFEVSGRQLRRGGTLTASLGGTLAGTELQASSEMTGSVSDWREGEIGVRLQANNPSGDVLMRQLGLAALPVGGGTDGSLSLSVSGTPRRGLETDLDARLAETSVTLSGDVALPVEGARVDLEASLQTEDVSVPALALGRSLPLLAGGIPVTLSAHLSGPPAALSVEDFTGDLAGVSVSGQGTLEQSDQATLLAGDLTVGEVDLQLLSELVLGSEAWTYAGADASGWPDAAFGGPALSGARLELDVTTDRLWVGARELSEATFGLSLAPERLSLSDLSASYAGGSLAGALDLTRSDGQATLSGRLDLSEADLASLVWSVDGAPVATGALELSAEFEAIGRSVSAMVAASSGSGTFTARDGEIRGLNPGALQAAISASDRGAAVDETSVRDLVAEALDDRPLPYRQISGTINFASGTARIGEVAVDAGDTEITGAGALDFLNWTLDGTVGLSLVPPEPDLVPDVTADLRVLLDGPLQAPEATLDVGPLVGYLTLRQTEQERRRLEEMERQLQERRRQQEELLRRLEEERRAEEARQRREEEARRQAEEEARRQAAEEEARRQAEEQARQDAEAADAASDTVPEGSVPTETPLPPIQPRTDIAPDGDNGAAPVNLPPAGTLREEPQDAIGSLIDRRFRLLQPEPLGPLGPPIEIGPAPGSRPSAPTVPPAGQRSDADPASQPFVITPNDRP